MNLRAMNKLQELAPDWKIGLSDHSEGIVASLVAAGLELNLSKNILL